MDSVKRASTIFFFVCLITSLLSLPPYSMAGDVTLVPSINLKGEYNDNVTFTRTNKKDDYLATVSPALTLDYVTEAVKLESKIILDVDRYADEKDLDTDRQRYVLNGGYQLKERWGVSGNLSYIKDTTLESELEETGIVNVRADRQRYNAGAGLSYQISEVSNMGIDYAYSRTDYDWPWYEDYDTDSISLSYNREFNNKLDVFTVQPRWSQRDSEVSQADDYGLSLGWTHQFSETFRLRAFLGGRYTEQSFNDGRQSDETWGGVADISLRKTGVVSSMDIGYSRNINNSTEGEQIEVDRIYCSFRQRVVRRLGVAFSGSLYFTRSESEFYNEDRRYFELTPSLYYQITENHSLNLAYSYSQEYDKMLTTDREAERNRVWISLNFRFPKKW